MMTDEKIKELRKTLDSIESVNDALETLEKCKRIIFEQNRHRKVAFSIGLKDTHPDNEFIGEIRDIVINNYKKEKERLYAKL